MTGTGFISASVAAATAVVGYDLLKDTRLARPSKKKRTIKGLGLCGSAAAGDTIVEIEIGGVSAGEYYNTTTGYAAGHTHVTPCSIEVPAGTEINLWVIDAPATNPINPLLVIE